MLNRTHSMVPILVMRKSGQISIDIYIDTVQCKSLWSVQRYRSAIDSILGICYTDNWGHINHTELTVPELDTESTANIKGLPTYGGP